MFTNLLMIQIEIKIHITFYATLYYTDRPSMRVAVSILVLTFTFKVCVWIDGFYVILSSYVEYRFESYIDEKMFVNCIGSNC